MDRKITVAAVLLWFQAIYRNQYAVGVVSGILLCMCLITVFNNSPTYSYKGNYAKDLRIEVQRDFAPTAQTVQNNHSINATKAAGKKIVNVTTEKKLIPTTTTTTTTVKHDLPTTTEKNGMQCICYDKLPKIYTETKAPEVKRNARIYFSPPYPAISGILPYITKNHQVDDTSIADTLKEKVRVLCWVMTSPQTLYTKAFHVYQTWGRRCNKVLFFSSQENSTFPAPVIKVETEEGRDHLTAKTMHAFKYIYDHHLNDAEWFMKADDDTFVIVENLRYFLSDRDPTEPVYYGHHFAAIVEPQGYYGGGGGYVISKLALERFGQLGFHNPMCTEDGGAEDVEFGKCMQSLAIHTADSYDEQGRSRFHGLDFRYIVHGDFPDWYNRMDSHGAKFGIDSISDYPISFHYMEPNAMYEWMYYVYHLKVFGINSQSKPDMHRYYKTKH